MTYEFEGKNEKEAIENAIKGLGIDRDQFDVEVTSEEKGFLFKKGNVRIKVYVNDGAPVRFNPGPANEFEREIVSYVEELIKYMGYASKLKVLFREDDKLGLGIDSDDSAILIGKHGRTLEALQVLVNGFVSRKMKNSEERFRVILDIENYRVRREENIIRMASEAADKVVSSGRSILMEPMNPFERRLVHTSLNDLTQITTKSEGDGLYKQVRIMTTGGK